MNNFQRNGSLSNTEVGSEFENQAKSYFAAQGIALEDHLSLEIGIEGKRKRHKFDLGSNDPKIIVECKSHTWTESQNMPSAKMMAWTEAMYYFYAAPKDYRKIFFALRDFSTKHNETLAKYYLRTYEHLIPGDVEFWEYDAVKQTAERIRQRADPLLVTTGNS
jgi:hypothetical protein